MCIYYNITLHHSLIGQGGRQTENTRGVRERDHRASAAIIK